MIVKEYFDFYSNLRSNESLGNWLRSTYSRSRGSIHRMLTRLIRNDGAMRGFFRPPMKTTRALWRRGREFPSMVGLDLATRVTCGAPYNWDAV